MEDKHRVSNEEHLGRIIEKFEPLWVKKMQASHLVLEIINIPEVRDAVRAIHIKETNGDYEGAAKLLLDAIRMSTQPGKWHMFVDALAECEETAILKDLLLEEGSMPSETEWLNEYVNYNLINVFAKTIADRLDLNSLLSEMLDKGLLLKKDLEELTKLIDQGQKWGANVCFLLILHRHNKDWYNIFLTILFNNEGQEALVELIDPEKYAKLMLASVTPEARPSDEDETAENFHEGEPGTAPLPEDNSSAGSRAACQCNCHNVQSELTELRAELLTLRSEMKSIHALLKSMKMPGASDTD